AVGAAGFYVLVAGPVLTGQRAAPFRGLSQRLEAGSVRLGLGGVVLFVAASIGQLGLQAAKIDVGPGTVITGTDWGQLWLSRVILGLVLGIGLAGVLRWGQDKQVGVWLRWGTLVVGLGMLVPFSLASHGAALSEAKNAAVFSDYLHLAATALWVGGLVHLALISVSLFKGTSESQRTAVLSRIVPRFSVLAVLSVGIVVVTGLYAAWAQVSSLGATTTPYGWTLVAKTVLVAPLLLLGAMNLFFTSPRLKNGQDGAKWLRRFVAGEVVLAVLVLLAVGYLTSLEPARQTAAREAQRADASYEDNVQGTHVVIAVSPGAVGPNEVNVMIRNHLGLPITNADSVRARITFLGQDLGSEFETLSNVGGGLYSLNSANLSLAGEWQLEVVVSRPDAFDARVAFRFEVGTGGGVPASTEPSGEIGSLLLGVELALVALVLLGLGMPMGALRSRMGTAFIGVGLVLFFTGGFFALNADVGDTGDTALTNPILPDAVSIARGEELYMQSCTTCHGVTGLGDGPAAAGLQPPPLDLTIHVPLHPDRALFGFIKNGVPGTAMPVWGESLSDEDIWHLVNYLRTIPEQAQQVR
ncbi:MAG: CopD family protein, partial [Chloroflexi bacterium]|nr:CopD family protein [Chloroflexota bacterium]